MAADRELADGANARFAFGERHRARPGLAKSVVIDGCRLEERQSPLRTRDSFSPVEVDLGVAAAARRRSSPASLRLALGAQIGSAELEALERGPGLQQGAVDGEVVAGELVLLAGEVEHGLEELAADVVLEQPLAVLGEGALVEGRVLDTHVQEPLEEQVVLESLAELALAANRRSSASRL